MKQGALRFQVVLLSLSIILMSCDEQATYKTATPIFLASTKTPTTTLQTTTALQQASLSGKVLLVSPAPAVKPFAFYVELRQADGNNIAGKIDTSSFPEFKFENIKPGIYELWVLIPSYALSISNCYDIGLPDSTWKLGHLISGNQPVFIEGISYREALSQSANENSSDPRVHDFYAVLENFEIKSMVDNKIDVNLICKSSK